MPAWSRLVRGLLLGVAAAATMSAPAHAAARAATAPATFLVGAAAESLDPVVPVYSGGFSASPPITRVHDDLSVRAIFVSNGRDAVELAVVDAQGFFAAYQEGRYGITDIRDDAAAAITAAHLARMTQGDIILQATHGHADPTLEGIWGPVPIPYLEEVHDRAVAALVEAARTARPAHLEWGTVDASQLDTTTIDTDSYPGWSADGLLTALRAVDADTGATLATYVEVPVHGAHVCGQCIATLSADYFGAVRDRLEAQLGGVAVVGPAVLGRQESPLEVTDIPTMEFLANAVDNFALQALGEEHWVTDATVASSESFVRLPATNAALLGLDLAWKEPEAEKRLTLATTGIYPIDRSASPPYLEGNVLGTWLTTLRIGGLVYVSMPGEPFPEVSITLRDHIRGADVVTVMSKGQDDFGYFFPAWVYPFTARYSSDHWLFSVAPQAGDEFIDGQLANAAAVGLGTTPYAAPEPLPTRYARDLHPGLQALAAPFDTDAGALCTATTTFESVYAPPVLTDTQAAGPPSWSFGDGTEATTGYLVNSQNYQQTGNGPVGAPRFTHTFGVGTYTVRVSQADRRGDRASWSLPVTVHPPLAATLTAAATGATVDYAVTTGGGDGVILAVRWAFADGTTADGPATIAHTFAAGVDPGAVVTVVDATGTAAAVALAGAGQASSGAPDCATPAAAARTAGVTAATPVGVPDTGAATASGALAGLVPAGLVVLGARRRRRR